MAAQGCLSWVEGRAWERGASPLTPWCRLAPVFGAAPCQPWALRLPLPCYAGAEAIRAGNPLPICVPALASHLFGQVVVYFWSMAFVQGSCFLLMMNMVLFST